MEIQIPLSQGLSLRFTDAPPAGNNYPTARLQKGLLLLEQDWDLTEEAVGFGVPVLKRGLQTIFPGSVELDLAQQGSIWKIAAHFRLNLVEKLSVAGNEHIENRLLYNAKNLMSALMRQVPFLRGMLTLLSNSLRRFFSWETTYVSEAFSTGVDVRFTVEPKTGRISIEVDTSGLPPDVTEMIMMNELGAHFFDRYWDSSGAVLNGQEVGMWDSVTAQTAGFESAICRVRFTLDQVACARLYRGRELIGSRLVWAGFGYSFSPSLQRMRYDVRIEKLP